VLGEDGKRFRTRSSEVVRLADLLDEARARCLAQLRELLEAAAARMGAWLAQL
jgi:arginyl-tRNA synthetase